MRIAGLKCARCGSTQDVDVMDGGGGPLCPEHWDEVAREDEEREFDEWFDSLVGEPPEPVDSDWTKAVDFLAVGREPITPYVASQDRETIFVGPGMDMIIGGP